DARLQYRASWDRGPRGSESRSGLLCRGTLPSLGRHFLGRREDVQLVPGVKLHRVAVLLNRDNAAEMQLRALSQTLGQGKRQLNGEVIRKLSCLIGMDSKP